MDSLLATSVSIYLRLIDYNRAALTSAGTADNAIAKLDGPLDGNNPQFIKVLSYSSDVVQTLNISSQSTGAGAGKIGFNSLRITKYLDATSPLLFKNAASGTPYRSAEILFVNAQNVLLSRLIYKLAAVKTIAWSSSSDGGVVENVEFDYGGQFIIVNKFNPDGRAATPSQAGWNRVRNVLDNDPESSIDGK